VLEEIRNFVIEKVIVAGITWLIGLLNPASAFIKACKAIYDIIMFFVERGSQILALVNAVIDSIAAIAKGSIGGAANMVETALARAIPVVIGFLASLLGVGGISEKIKSVIETIRKPINSAIDWVIHKAVALVKAAGKFIASLFGGKKEKDDKTPETSDPAHDAKVVAGLAAIDQEDQKYLESGEIGKGQAMQVAATVTGTTRSRKNRSWRKLFERTAATRSALVAATIRTFARRKLRAAHPVFKSITVVEGTDTWDYQYTASLSKKKKGERRKGTVGPLKITRRSLSFTAETKRILIQKFKAAFPPGQLGQFKDAKLDIRHKVSISNTINHVDSALKQLTVAEAAKVLSDMGHPPEGKGRPGIIAAARELLQAAHNDESSASRANLFIGASGKNRRIGKRYDPGDAPGASATSKRSDPQKKAFIEEYGFVGTEFHVTIDVSVDGEEVETWETTA